MKANLISSGLVNLRLCLHCGAFSRFASFGIASAPKGFLARVVMGTQHVEITGSIAWWENVTALACLCLSRISLAVLVFFFLPPLCFVQLFLTLSLVSQQVFSPIQPNFFGFPLLCYIFVLCYYGVVFVCSFSFSSVSTFPLKMFVYLWLFSLWDLCFFSTLSLPCFLSLGVHMQMPNAIISVYTASVPVILFIAIHYWKKNIHLIGPDWVPWWFQAVIKGCHLRSRVDQ